MPELSAHWEGPPPPGWGGKLELFKAGSDPTEIRGGTERRFCGDLSLTVGGKEKPVETDA